MPSIRGINEIIFVILVFSLVDFIFQGCSEPTPFNDNSKYYDSGSGILLKNRDIDYEPSPNIDKYPQHASSLFQYHYGSAGYKSGILSFGNGTKLTVPEGALTPPPGTPPGLPIIIRGSIDFDAFKKELLFDFGPSGCQFDPNITLRIKYSDLSGMGIPILYYIDKKGNYIPQEPDEINLVGKWMKLHIDHFSRYAVSFSQ
jgi:hypothetical protein